MELDLGIDFSKAEAEVEEGRKAPPPADYTVQVSAIDQKIGKTSNRPYLNWQLKIVNSTPDVNGKVIFYVTPLPWTNPSTNQFETSGIGFLVDMTKALQMPWSGGKIETSNYIGRTTMVRVINEVAQNGTGLNAKVEKILG